MYPDSKSLDSQNPTTRKPWRHTPPEVTPIEYRAALSCVRSNSIFSPVAYRVDLLESQLEIACDLLTANANLIERCKEALPAKSKIIPPASIAAIRDTAQCISDILQRVKKLPPPNPPQ